MKFFLVTRMSRNKSIIFLASEESVQYRKLEISKFVFSSSW